MKAMKNTDKNGAMEICVFKHSSLACVSNRHIIYLSLAKDSMF